MSSKTENSARSGKGFQSVASSFAPTAKKLLGKNGFVELDIITDWPDIAGEKLSAHSHPQNIDFKRGQRCDGILNIAVDSGAFAIEIEYKKKNIIEKINTYFGYGAVSDLRINQAPNVDFADNNLKSTGEKKILVTLKEQNYIDEQTAEIENQQLRESLKKLGNNIFGQEDKK